MHRLKYVTKKSVTFIIIMIIIKWMFLSLFQVHTIFIHSEYNYINLKSDLAMLLLNSSVEFTAKVRPVCLWNPSDTSIQSIIGKDGVVRSNLKVTCIMLECVKF